MRAAIDTRMAAMPSGQGYRQPADRYNVGKAGRTGTGSITHKTAEEWLL